VTQTAQVAGALVILAAFVSQMSTQDIRSQPVLYLLSNIVGSAVLAADAYTGRDWGFLLLEGTWAIVSVVGLARALVARTRQVSTSGPVSRAHRRAARPGGRHRAAPPARRPVMPAALDTGRAAPTQTIPALPGARTHRAPSGLSRKQQADHV
jgi:hypothetical protein